MGTMSVLEGARHTDSVKSIVVVTSDKCYENNGGPWPYRETDPLGGSDIYSSSKACTEILTQSYRRSFFKADGPKMASVRAGNVIGGGDWAPYRIVPDIVRAALTGEVLTLRRPYATRPWQHVLEPLSGYLKVAELLSSEGGEKFAEAWNFGPAQDAERPVLDMVESARSFFPQLNWRVDPPPFEEATYLAIDSGKSRRHLSWRPQLDWREAVEFTYSWYSRYGAGEKAGPLVAEQIKEYTARLDKGAR
jgi:CDP-glucose 4,6-dehydratase